MSPASRKAKKTKSRARPRPRRIEPAQPRLKDDIAGLAAALEQVLETAFRQAKRLARTKDPIDAEIAASSLLALWSGLELVDQPDPATFFGRAMIAFLESRATPDALALLLGFSAVEQVETIMDSHRAIRRLSEAGVAAPPWADHAGRARLESAWLGSDPYGDQDFLVGRFGYEGEAAHDLAVLVDHNILDIAKDIAIVRSVADLRAEFERQPDISLRDVGPQEYADRLADALENLDQTWDPPVTEGARLLRPLLEARLLHLPRAKPIKRRAVSQVARDRLYTAFRRSEPGRALGRDTQLARLCIDYAADYYSDALHWSPIVVELFLTDWLPRKVTLFDDEVERLPVVLRSWLRFVGEQRGFADRLVDEMLAALDAFADGFRKAMGDSSSFGPAKSIAQQMQADGVDLEDPRAVQAWIEAFNARPFEEREGLTGGPTLH